MKRSICLLVLLMSCTHLLFAQGYYEEKPNTFLGAAIAGMNLTQVDGDNYAGYHNVGFTVGGSVYTVIAQNVAASMEILYAQKGATGKFKGPGAIGASILDYDLKLNYAQVPVLLYYYDKHWNHFGAGISYSRLINAEEDVETNFPYDFKLNEHPFKKSDFSMLLGGNLHVWKGLFIGGRFEYSLVPIRTKVPIGLGRKEQYNNTVTFRVTYMFGKRTSS